MTNYSDIEIQTAKNLLKKGYKWIVRDKTFYGNAIFAHKEKPHKSEAGYWIGTTGFRRVCNEEVPIFQSVGIEDTEPTSLKSIVHPQILDDAEKRYLKAVIRPFRDRVKYIAKTCVEPPYSELAYYIYIRFNDGNGDMDFPAFDESHMYKCMEDERAYTLEELGL